MMITWQHILKGQNIALIKYFDDKDLPDSNEELKKIYKDFIKNGYFDDVTKKTIKTQSKLAKN